MLSKTAIKAYPSGLFALLFVDLLTTPLPPNKGAPLYFKFCQKTEILKGYHISDYKKE